MIAGRLGKIPTAAVRRRISVFSRSCGLLDPIWRQISRGESGEGEEVVAGGVEVLGRPEPRGRLRNSYRPPGCLTSFSTRRVDTPGR
jgi:hypothetical protein